MKDASVENKRDKENHPRTLVIINFPDEIEGQSYQEFKKDHLMGDDVVTIESPKDEADLKKQLKEMEGQFDRVFVSSHGAKGEQSALMKLTTQEGSIPIADVMTIINENCQTPPKEIHLYACHVGSHFEKIEQKNTSSHYYQDLARSTNKGQYVFLHGDDKSSSKANNMLSMGTLLKSNVGSVTNTIFMPHLDSVKLLRRNDEVLDGSEFEFFHHPSYLNQLDGQDISSDNFISYLRTSIIRAQEFEMKNGLALDSQIHQRLEDITPHQVKDSLSRLLSLDILKSSNEEDELIRRWKGPIDNDEINTSFVYYNESPLMEAARNGYSQFTEFLMDKGANPNSVSNKGMTALRLACAFNHVDTVRSLLNYPDTDPNIPDVDGWTALMSAASDGHQEVAHVLLEDKRTDLTQENKAGQTALQIAHGNGRTHLAELISTEINARKEAESEGEEAEEVEGIDDFRQEWQATLRKESVLAKEAFEDDQTLTYDVNQGQGHQPKYLRGSMDFGNNIEQDASYLTTNGCAVAATALIAAGLVCRSLLRPRAKPCVTDSTSLQDPSQKGSKNL